ncbi:MAG TPA: PAS domain S-box protein [Ramlibacter sp.]
MPTAANAPAAPAPEDDAFPAAGDGASGDYASAFHHAPVGTLLMAADGRPLRANQAFCELTGQSEQDIVAGGAVPLHAEDQATVLRERALCLAGEQATFRNEVRYRRGNGETVWADQSCTLVRGHRGEPVHFIVQAQDIGGRKRAEQALRESEARFRSLTLLSASWYWEQDDQFRFVSFEGHPQEGRWRPDSAALGLCRWDIAGLRPLDGTWARHRLDVQAHRAFRELECVRVRPGRPPVYVSISGEPVFDEHDRFTGYRGTTRDITAAKALETHLRDAQGLLHMAARIGRLGAWSYVAGQERMTWSDELCRLCEVDVGFAPTLEQVFAFFAPAHRPLARSTVQRCLVEGEGFDVETPAAMASGRTRWFRLIGEAERDDDGRVRRIHGACQDITGSRQAAEHTRRQARQLTNTLERLTDGFFTLDRDWRFTYLNPEAQRLMARPRGDLLGRRITDEFPAPGAGGILAHYRRALDENTVVQAEEYYEPLDLWVQLKIYPSAEGVAVYVRDVTERVRSRQQLLQLNAQLEARVKERTARLEIANRELEAFSYAIAHDLRAPLGAIQGFGDSLQRVVGASLDERGRHYLRRILAGVHHMRELTDGLLSLAGLSRASLRARPVDLSALAQAAVAACRERAPQRRAEVAIAPGMVVRGDPRLLAHVMDNLVGNAWKFTSRVPCARIEVGRLDGSPPRYFVRDNGAGFDEAWAGKLFEPFQRLHTQDEFEGTGIGLAIVRKVVLLHGGRVWAESVAGEGATFYFTLG